MQMDEEERKRGKSDETVETLDEPWRMWLCEVQQDFAFLAHALKPYR